VAALDVSVPETLDSKVLLREPLRAVVAGDHRLAARRRIGMRELANEAIIAFPVGTGLRAAAHRAAEDAGFTLSPQFETSEMTRMLELVQRGLGVTLVPASTRLHDFTGVVAILLDPEPHRSVGAVWRRDRALPPASRAFLELLLQAGSADASERGLI
jgi:DNA-binding transcriptional LysR family regulator